MSPPPGSLPGNPLKVGFVATSLLFQSVWHLHSGVLETDATSGGAPRKEMVRQGSQCKWFTREVSDPRQVDATLQRT